MNRRRIGVLLLLVLLLLGLGLGGLNDGGDGDGLTLLPESELEITETTPAPTETPTPAPGGGGGGDGTTGDGDGDDSSGDGDDSGDDDVLLQDSESNADGDGVSPEDSGQSGDEENSGNDKDYDSEEQEENQENAWGGGSGGGGGGDGGSSADQSTEDYDGHLYLEVVGDRLRVEATNVLPGDEGSESATLTNNGTVNGTLLAAFDNVTDAENGLTEPEQETGDSGPEGELSEHLEVRLSVTPEGGSEEYLFGNDTEYVTLTDIEEGTNTTDGVLDVDENATVTLDWRLPEETGNEVQTDRVTFDLLFYLIHNEHDV